MFDRINMKFIWALLGMVCISMLMLYCAEEAGAQPTECSTEAPSEFRSACMEMLRADQETTTPTLSPAAAAYIEAKTGVDPGRTEKMEPAVKDPYDPWMLGFVVMVFLSVFAVWYNRLRLRVEAEQAPRLAKARAEPGT